MSVDRWSESWDWKINICAKIINTVHPHKHTTHFLRACTAMHHAPHPHCPPSAPKYIHVPEVAGFLSSESLPWNLRGHFVGLMGCGAVGEGCGGQNGVSSTPCGLFGVLCVVSGWRLELSMLVRKTLRLRVQASCFRSPDDSRVGELGCGGSGSRGSRACTLYKALEFSQAGHRKNSLSSLGRRWCKRSGRKQARDPCRVVPVWSGDAFGAHCLKARAYTDSDRGWRSLRSLKPHLQVLELCFPKNVTCWSFNHSPNPGTSECNHI